MHIAEQHYTSGDYWRERRNSDASYKVRLVDLLFHSLRLEFPQGIKAAEIGCGQGAFLFPLAEHFAKHKIPFDLTGYDISPQAVEMAGARKNPYGDRLRFFVGSAKDAAPGLDVIFIMDVLEHLENPIQFLRDLTGKARHVVVHLPIEHSVGHLLMRKTTKSHARFRHVQFFSWESAQIFFDLTPFRIAGHQFTSSTRVTIDTEPRFSKRALLVLRYWLYLAFPSIAPALSGGSVLLLLETRE